MHLGTRIIFCYEKTYIKNMKSRNKNKNKILTDYAVKALQSICQQIGKLSSSYRTGKV